MRRKRKVWYSVAVPGHWWCGKGLGWVKDPVTVPYRVASNFRTMFNFRKAVRHMEGLPEGAMLSRWFYKKGQRYLADFKI